MDSTPGRGSTFAITLPTGPLDGVRIIDKPAEAVQLEPAPHRQAPSATALAGRRILLVEDGPDNQVLIRTLLTKAGAHVEIAGNGRIALARLEAESFDLVLMDIQMPEMDGYHATRELRRRGCRLPIIALTAHALVSERQRCEQAGCDDYLSKPVDRILLVETVQRYTDGSSTTGPSDPQAANATRSSGGNRKHPALHVR